jgi:hypothetical protein
LVFDAVKIEARFVVVRASTLGTFILLEFGKE